MAAAEQCGWTDESTQTLISIWGTTSIQDGFDGTRRNNSVYKEIAQKMREMGYNFTHAQIVTKCKNLRKKYTQEKDSNGKSGNPPTEWPYFEMLNDIFGDRPISCPPHTIDTSLSALNTSGSSSSSTEMMANLDLSGSDVPESTQGGASASSVDADLWRGAGSTVSKRKRNGSPLKKRGKKKTKADTIVSGISNMLEESTKKFEESFFQQQQLMLTEQFKMEEEMQERQAQRAHERQMELFQMLGNLITKSSASQQPTSSSALSHPHMHPLQYNSSQTSHSMPSTRQPTTTAASLRPHHMHTSHQMPNPKQPTTTTASSRPHNMHASHQMPNSKQPISTSASSTPHHMHPSPNSMTPWDHARDYETLVLPPRPRLTNRQDPPNPGQPSTTMLQSLFKPWQGL